MKHALIIHGMPSEEEYFSDEYPSPSNSHWLPWLQKELLKLGVIAQTPEMPTPYLPEYEQWSQVFEQFSVSNNTTLIGHSCGAGFLVRWLSENPISIHQLILVAPWVDPDNTIGNGFFNFSIDPEAVGRFHITVLSSKDDDVECVVKTVETLKECWPTAEYRCFEQLGHFTLGDMGTDEFPELLEIAVGN